MNPDPDSPERKTLTEQWIVGAGFMVFWAVIILAFFWGCSPCPAADLRTLEWDANPASQQIQGYRIWKMPAKTLLATAQGSIATVPLEVGEVVALTAYNVTGESALSDPVTITAPVPALDRSGWTATASSAESAGENTPPPHAIDGNPATMWHSKWNALAPHYLTIALPRAATVSRLDYTPRQDNNANGRILAWEIQSSDDGLAWQPWVSGTWANDATIKTAALPLRAVRYFRLWGNERFASAAEINLRGSYDPEPPKMVRFLFQHGDDLVGWKDLPPIDLPLKGRGFVRAKSVLLP